MRADQTAPTADLFHSRGLRCTPQRFAVLDFLLRSPAHPTAEEIFREINRTDPRASRATIYNNLRTLIEAGLAREFVHEARSARFGAQVEKHHHFICERCGNIEDIEWFEVKGIPKAHEAQTSCCPGIRTGSARHLRSVHCRARKKELQTTTEHLEKRWLH